MNCTQGLGVIDDPGGYKPVHYARDRFGEHGRHDRGAEHIGQGEPRDGRRGERGHRGRDFPDVRVIHSDIREADIIYGTEKKLLEAFEKGRARFNPDFVLLSSAPSASMIGTDLKAVAEQITAQTSLPTACVPLDGQQDYVYGIGCTLELMGKLLLRPMDIVPDTVNLLGCNTIDWSTEAVERTETLLTDAGFRVLSRWGSQERTENLRLAASASVNLVAHSAGLRLARWMETEFGTPFVAAAPFGAVQCGRILECLRNKTPLEQPPADTEPEALVIGEQLTAEAVRAALLERGFGGVRVCSFYDMDKTRLLPGDCRLGGEDDLTRLLGVGNLRLIVGNADYQALATNTAVWLSLPDPFERHTEPSALTGDGLDRWLESYIKGHE
jgi:hypothetical protein